MSIDFNSIPKIAGIYKIINKINGKYYLGSSNNCKQRAYSHFCELKNNKHANIKLQRSYNKYGINAFEFIIISCVLDENFLAQIEQEYLNEYKPYLQEIGYNICVDAKSTKGLKQSPETIELKRKIFSGSGNPFYGKHHSATTKQLIANKLKGKTFPHMFRKQSKETIDKQRERRRNRLFICINNNKIYKSSGDVKRDLNLKSQSVAQCLSGKKHCVFGYIFINIKNENELDYKKIEDEFINIVKTKGLKWKKKVYDKFIKENNPFYNEVIIGELLNNRCDRKVSEKTKLKARHTKSRFKFICNETKQEFYSLAEAGQVLGICHLTVKKALFNNIKIKGYSFSFLDEKDRVIYTI